MAYLGQEPISGNFVKLDTISVVNGQATYSMQRSSVNYSPASANHMIVSLNGIIQNPGSSYTISAHQITFASNLVTGDVIDFIMVLGDVLNIGTPSDNTVTNDKLATAPTIISKGAGSDSGAIKLNCENNSHGVTIKGPPHSAAQSYTLTLPSTAPAANKMLQSDGSGNLSFVDAPSGGLKFLNRQTVSSSTAFVAFDNTYINTTYDDYIIKGSRVVPVTDGAHMRWFTSSQNGGNMTPGWYSNGIVQRMDNSYVSYTGYYGNVTYFEMGLDLGTAAGESMTWTMNLNNTNNSAQGGTTATVTFAQHNANNYYYHGIMHAYQDQGAITDYIRCYLSTGNIASGTFTLYGIVKS